MISLEQLLEVCRRLNDSGAEYVVIGGWAIFLHGYERATRDVDIVIRDSEENVEKVKKALEDLLPEACAELRPEDVHDNVVVRMAGEDLVVDLIRNVGDVDYERLCGRIQSETIGDVVLPYADLEAMLELKKGVRDEDRRDFLFLKGKQAYLRKQKG